jgi:hypothetical protein
LTWWDLLFQSFQQYSIVWILISAGIGGFIGALAKFLFEQVLGTRYASSVASKAALRKYTYPILQAADSLDRRIQNLEQFIDSKWFDDPSDNYYRLSTLYQFGCYFAWCKILEDEAFIEYETSDRKAKEFSIQFYRVFKGITSFYYFEDIRDELSPSIADVTPPRLALTAIGELMRAEGAKESKDAKDPKDGLPKVLRFVDFVRKYEESAEFRKWFSYLEKLLSNLTKSQTDGRYNRLIVFAINLRVFVSFLDPRKRQTAPRKIYSLSELHPKVAGRIRKELVKSGYSKMIVDSDDRSLRVLGGILHELR